ncbi:MAG: transporter substrate-binding domain-containing protein [Bacteroidales bacterium]|nr:transporter substrate-binding domain-containing protein [Bacteroidales bacterium]
MRKFSFVLMLLALILTTSSCRQKATTTEKKFNTIAEIKKRGKLRILTLYSSTSYFLYKGQPMGYEYDLASKFAESIGVETEVIVAENVTKLTKLLREGNGDLIAYNMPITNIMKDSVLFCGHQYITHQVLVQQKNGKSPTLHDVTQLIDKEVTVINKTRYFQRLKNLNDELGGGIKINLIKKDTVTTEDLIEMVSDDDIAYTVADNNIANLNKTYFGNIDVNLAVSFPQRLSWMVQKENTTLASALNKWFANSVKTVAFKTLSKRYFEQSKRSQFIALPKISKGKISPYDDLFKKYAKEIGWDWRLLAAIAFIESKFDPSEISWSGAKGLMQLMPRTAAAVGIYGKEIYNPETNIRGAVNSIRIINRLYTNVSNKEEKQKFIIAAYNCGIGHIMDAQALAQKYGKSRTVWDNNVAHYIQLKSNPEFYSDRVCHYGYLRGSETTQYVNKVISTYKYYTSKTKK